MDAEIAWINFFGTVLAAAIPSAVALVAILVLRRFNSNKNLVKNLYADVAFYRHMIDLYAVALEIHEESNKKNTIRKQAVINLGYKPSASSQPAAIENFFTSLRIKEEERDRILSFLRP